MRILITAIGSMSAECAIRQLKNAGNYVVGCDIYPGDWHYETTLCDDFLQAPLVTKQKEYINFLLNTCNHFELNYIIPLTDLEIDVINKYRFLFDEKKIVLCMQDIKVLDIVRDKYKMFTFFKDDDYVPSIRTVLLADLPSEFVFPCIAKPLDGRSSEGLIRDASYEQVMAIENKDRYIIQEQLDGNVFAVDFCRNSKTGICCAIPRLELLRTKNGAGLTIQTCSDSKLLQLVSYIGKKLNINGCVNMEFIFNDGKYYLIDINPRFSAGVAFSLVSGYDMIINHLSCFCNKDIDNQITIKEQIIIKKYQEVVPEIGTVLE